MCIYVCMYVCICECVSLYINIYLYMFIYASTFPIWYILMKRQTSGRGTQVNSYKKILPSKT